ncbi:uncharacterized protein LOC132707245 [Cylas formicarius]|uniref:uncharacterized protein LOC132707245 n=1 Tax=Cylas formicarius TaxID=197179 RepID=UPI002958D3F3|nr:uncharacterized protein LOC132707245 [Cylas formicarius]
MSQKLELPDPAPAAAGRPQWKEMVDSVVEFIAASRTMLEILRGRVKDHEAAKEEEIRKLEDDKIRMEFYKECLRVDVPSRAEDGESKRTKRLQRHPKQTVRADDGITQTKGTLPERSVGEGVTSAPFKKPQSLGYSGIHAKRSKPEGAAPEGCKK